MSATADGKKKVFLIFAIVKNDLKINNLQIVVCATQCNLMNTKMSTKKNLEEKGTIQYHGSGGRGLWGQKSVIDMFLYLKTPHVYKVVNLAVFTNNISVHGRWEERADEADGQRARGAFQVYNTK